MELVTAGWAGAVWMNDTLTSNEVYRKYLFPISQAKMKVGGLQSLDQSMWSAPHIICLCKTKTTELLMHGPDDEGGRANDKWA